MNGYSATNIFTQDELELHRQATTLIGYLPETPWTRCHELARAVAATLRKGPIPLLVVDGKFGIIDHSWITLLTPTAPGQLDTTPGAYRHIILDVYSIGSAPMVQMHDMGSVGLRGARLFTEGPERDDIDRAAIEVLLGYMKSRKYPSESHLLR